MNDLTINQNIAECLRSVNDIGGAKHVNICNGSESWVPWGAIDWALYGMVGAALLMLLILILIMLVSMVRGY